MVECLIYNNNGVVGGVICPTYGGKGGGGQCQEVPDVTSLVYPKYRLNTI